MSVSFCLPHPVAVSAFMICRGLCACTEMLWMCVLYVSFGSKVRPRTFGCVAMGSALLFIVRSRLLVYTAGGVLDMCLCFCCGGVGGEWVGGLDKGRERWGGVMSV